MSKGFGCVQRWCRYVCQDPTKLIYMRTVVVFFLFTVVVLAACKKKGKNCPTDSYAYSFKDNAQVDTITVANSFLAANTGAGNKRVFKYVWSHSECPNIQDGMG